MKENFIKRADSNLAWYRATISVVFGIIGFLVNLYPLNLPQLTTFKVSIFIGLIFPLIIAKAWGFRYGLLCALAGGCQSMWWVWQSDGYGILYSAPFFTVWIAFQGLITDWQNKTEKPKWYQNQYVAEACFRFFSELGYYTIFPFLVSFNPPLWDNTITANTISLVFINTVVIKHIIAAYTMLLICNVLLKITFIRRFFRLCKNEGEVDSSHIVSFSILVGFLLVFGDIVIDNILTKAPNDSLLDISKYSITFHSVIYQLIIFISCLIAGITMSQFLTQKLKSHKALAEKEERYRIIADKTLIMIYDNNLKSGYIDWSGNVEAVTGYTVEEFKNVNFDRFKEMIHPDGRDEAVKIMDQAIQECSPNVELKFYFKQKDGSYKYIYDNATIQIDSQGKPDRALGIMRDITHQKEAQDKLLDYQQQLKSLAFKLSLVEEQERRQVAVQLHDTIGQTLVICGIKLSMLNSLMSSEETKKAVDEITDLTREVIEQTKSLTFDMSSPILYEIGFTEAVMEYLDSEIKNKHKIEYQVENNTKNKLLSKEMEVFLFRDVKEVLINIVKHADASKIKVAFRKSDDDMFEVIVEDDGMGFDTSKVKIEATRTGGFGLFSTKERLECIGGEFNIESVPGRGTKAILRVPLNKSVFSENAIK